MFLSEPYKDSIRPVYGFISSSNVVGFSKGSFWVL